ncbi:MAG: transcriptional regulator FNR, partial [Gammaproteobacteria bacterium]|nr:transcriptional regulator FNR [Gammaproteobacteria bacterium]
MDGAQVAELDRIVNRRRVLRRGEYLFRHGESFSRLYALRCGSVKVYTQLHG